MNLLIYSFILRKLTKGWKCIWHCIKDKIAKMNRIMFVLQGSCQGEASLMGTKWHCGLPAACRDFQKKGGYLRDGKHSETRPFIKARCKFKRPSVHQEVNDRMGFLIRRSQRNGGREVTNIVMWQGRPCRQCHFPKTVMIFFLLFSKILWLLLF